MNHDERKDFACKIIEIFIEHDLNAIESLAILSSLLISCATSQDLETKEFIMIVDALKADFLLHKLQEKANDMSI